MDNLLSSLQQTQWTVLTSRLLLDDGGSIMPLISTVMFFVFFAVMFLFVLTDRRRSHHRRMEGIMHDDGTDRSHESHEEDSRHV